MTLERTREDGSGILECRCDIGSRFFDSHGDVRRILDIEAPHEEAAIHLCYGNSVESNAVVELWYPIAPPYERPPLTAQLYGCDTGHAHL